MQKKKLTVAIVSDSFPKLSETFVVNHIAGVLDSGHHVDIYSFNKSSDDIYHPKVNEYRLLSKTLCCKRMPKNRFLKYAEGLQLFLSGIKTKLTITINSLNVFRHGLSIFNLRLLYFTTVFDGKKYDIVHAHFGPIGLQLVKLMDIGAIHGRLVVSFHGYDLNKKSITQVACYYAPLFERADKILVNSLFSRDKLLDLGAPKGKVCVFPIPVDVDFFSPKLSPFKNKQICFLSVSRLSKEKGIIFSLRAIKKYIEKYDENIQYVIVGDGPLLGELSNFISQNNLADNVNLLLAQTPDSIVRLMSEADAFIFPSIELPTGEVDTQGVVIQEAQSMGLPVIASDVGGVKYGILDGRSGFLVEQKDIFSLVQCMRKLVVEPELKYKMGAVGRKNVMDNFSSSIVRERLNKLYFNLL